MSDLAAQLRRRRAMATSSSGLAGSAAISVSSAFTAALQLLVRSRFCSKKAARARRLKRGAAFARREQPSKNSCALFPQRDSRAAGAAACLAA